MILSFSNKLIIFSGESNNCFEDSFILPLKTTTIPPIVTTTEAMVTTEQVITTTLEDQAMDVDDPNLDPDNNNPSQTNTSPNNNPLVPANTCPAVPNMDSGNDRIQLWETLNSREKFPQPIDLDAIDLTDYPYRDEYSQIIITYLSKKLDRDLFMDNKNWLELYIDHDNPSNSAPRCKICYHYAKEFFITPRRKVLLASEKGVLKPTKSENLAMINNHKNSKTHKAVLKALKQRKIDELTGTVLNEERHLKVTNSIIRTIHFEVMTGLSFNVHRQLVELQKRNGVRLGHLCNSRATAKKMTIFLSEEMHREFLAFMKREEPYFSLIMDESE